MADADAVWFWAEDVVADLPTFPAAPVVEGDCACPRSLCERFGDRRTLSDVPRGLHGTDPGSHRP